MQNRFQAVLQLILEELSSISQKSVVSAVFVLHREGFELYTLRCVH